jgi:hypothetical protein
MSVFFLLLLHSVSTGNPNGNLVASLATAWGISSTTLWTRNSKAVLCLLASDTELANAFKESLKFKLTRKHAESKNKVFQYIESKNKVGESKGWLREQFFASNIDCTDLKVEKCKLLLLLCAVCSGNPNGNFVELLAHAWGVSPTTIADNISSHLPLMLAQANTQLPPPPIDTLLPCVPPAMVSPDWAPHLATDTQAANPFEELSPRPAPNSTNSLTVLPWVPPSPNVVASSALHSPPPIPNSTKSSALPFNRGSALNSKSCGQFYSFLGHPDAAWKIQSEARLAHCGRGAFFDYTT